MRFTAVLAARKIAELTLKHSNLPESYVRQCTEVVKYVAPKLRSHRQIVVKRFKKYYDLHKPWTDQFQAFNHPVRNLGKVWVEPVKEWSYFRGDRVEILCGNDKGKQGFVSYIVQERNWVLVRGLNMMVLDIGSKIIPKALREAPLLIDRQVSLVDPVDLRPTKIEWRYDENGNRVRVSLRSGKILPIPDLEEETHDYKLKKAYEGEVTEKYQSTSDPGSSVVALIIQKMENLSGSTKDGAKSKDTVDEDLSNITFVPKLKTFEMEIMEEYAIFEDRIPAKTYFY